MKINQFTVQNIRGIRSPLTFRPECQNMVIFGNNGTGKSAVIDAIDFLLTGNISRISGEGTGTITLFKHGKHIDIENASEAFVSAEVQLPGHEETCCIQRNIGHRLELGCEDDFQAELEPILAMAQNEHHILSRRKILELIISQPRERAQKISALLNLSEFERFRKDLQTTKNRDIKEQDNKNGVYQRQKSNLIDYLQSEDCSEDNVLRIVNQLRESLNATLLETLEPNEISYGLGITINADETKFQIPSTIDTDIGVVQLCLEMDINRNFEEKITAITNYYRTIHKEIHSELINNQMLFYELGVQLIEDKRICPLCGHEWDDITIQEIIDKKLSESKDLKEKYDLCISAEKEIRKTTDKLTNSIQRLRTITEDDQLKDENYFLIQWIDNLHSFEIKELQEDLTTDQLSQILKPNGGENCIDRIIEYKNQHRKDETPEERIYKRLIAIENAYKEYKKIKKELNKATLIAEIATQLFEKLNQARDSVLTKLYDDIKDTFSEYYQYLNSNDEGNFSTSFNHSESSFDIEVDFMGRGMNAPHALHSEGHQDSMGVCLFLALNKHLSLDTLQLIVLDDVIMAIDVEHRKRFCELIKEKFSDYQFIITTHDFVWASQLQNAGVVNKKNMIKFINWDIETGPLVTETEDVFKKIQEFIDHDDIPTAAAILRREYEMRMNILADYMGTEVKYRMDNRYGLYDFMGGVYSRYKSLFGEAINSAQSWGNEERQVEIMERKEDLGEKFNEVNTYIKDVHSQVHYTNWAQLTRHDFQPVFDILRTYLELISCPECHGHLLVSRRRDNTKFLDCGCGHIHWNLNRKE